jgi:hypothetical protein
MKVPEGFLKNIIDFIIKEEIRKVKGGFKVYPKKPKKGEQIKKAFSKKPMSYQKALKQLRAIERSKSLKEVSQNIEYTIETEKIKSAIDRAFQILDFENQNLKSFLYRLSRVESGGNPSGLDKITHHTKNPFQLDEPAIKNVIENINLRRWREFINEKRGKNPAKLSKIENQSYNEIINNNILSALFALLYILWLNKNWKPDDRNSIVFSNNINNQAKFWKEKYNTASGKGKIEDFLKKNL